MLTSTEQATIDQNKQFIGQMIAKQTSNAKVSSTSAITQLIINRKDNLSSLRQVNDEIEEVLHILSDIVGSSMRPSEDKSAPSNDSAMCQLWSCEDQLVVLLNHLRNNVSTLREIVG